MALSILYRDCDGPTDSTRTVAWVRGDPWTPDIPPAQNWGELEFLGQCGTSVANATHGVKVPASGSHANGGTWYDCRGRVSHQMASQRAIGVYLQYQAQGSARRQAYLQ